MQLHASLVIALGLVRGVAAAEPATCDKATCDKAKPATYDKFPEQPLLASKSNTGVAFPGGGVRAYSVGLGVVRALRQLGLEDAPRYFSMVSGGNWLGNAYLYAESPAGGEEELVGPYTPPQDLDEKALKRDGGLVSGPSNGDSRFIWEQGTCVLDELGSEADLDGCWRSVVVERFVLPFGIGSKALAAWDEEHATELESKFDRRAEAIRRRGDAIPPYPLTNMALYGPADVAEAQAPAYATAHYPPLVATPHAAGSTPTKREVTFTYDDGAKKEVPLGGLIDTWALWGTRDPYALADAMSHSSLAYGSVSTQLPVDFLPDSFSRRLLNWLDARNAVPELQAGPDPMLFHAGDGGNNGDNAGFGALLQRGVDKILWVLPTMQPLNLTWDPLQRPPTYSDIDQYMSAYFGYTVGDETENVENGYLWSQCHFFEQRGFAGMAAQLVDSARGGRGGFARVRRAVTVANEAYGIEAGREVSLLIVYPHFDVKGVCSYTYKSGRCPKKYRGFPTYGLADRNAPTSKWYDRLPRPTRRAIYQDDKWGRNGGFNNFPYYSLATQQTLDPRQVNLLANFAAWSVLEHRDAVVKFFKN